jgi:hypothetical protein
MTCNHHSARDESYCVDNGVVGLEAYRLQFQSCKLGFPFINQEDHMSRVGKADSCACHLVHALCMTILPVLVPSSLHFVHDQLDSRLQWRANCPRITKKCPTDSRTLEWECRLLCQWFVTHGEGMRSLEIRVPGGFSHSGC